MFNKFIALCVIPLIYCCLLSATNAPTKGTIRWFTDYNQGLNQAKSTSMPLLIFLTGSDWCGWCNKLDEEVFDTRDFAEAAGNKFVFVKLDFPLYAAQDPQTKALNKQLQQKFEVRSFPTVILYDAQQNQKIGTTGYRAGGGRQYADHLMKILNDYSSYKQKMSALDTVTPSAIELKQLHDKAKELGLNNDINKIVQFGINSELSLYFLIERYRLFATEGRTNTQEAVALKQQLLAADPNNEQKIPYHLAVIEFESCCKGINKNNQTPEAAIAPLLSYIDRFGTQDKDNLWRLQMIISQVFLDKNQLSDALKYAQKSYTSAPPSVQAEIAVAVQNIQSLLSASPTAAISKK